MRFWVGWYGGADGDYRPIRDDVATPAWACSGETGGGLFTLCAVVDAQSEDEAWEVVLSYWPEAQKRFCEERPPGWLPLAPPGEENRFQCIVDKMRARCLKWTP